jgi:hypothetical protein
MVTRTRLDVALSVHCVSCIFLAPLLIFSSTLKTFFLFVSVATSSLYHSPGVINYEKTFKHKLNYHYSCHCPAYDVCRHLNKGRAYFLNDAGWLSSQNCTHRWLAITLYPGKRLYRVILDERSIPYLLLQLNSSVRPIHESRLPPRCWWNMRSSGL